MIHKLKYLFLVVLCFAAIGGAVNVSAQVSDKILVSASGKTLRQSDIDKMIEFYEWAFQAEFGSKQRADFQRFTEREFRNDPAQARATVDDIVQTLPKILAAREDVQADTRKNFLAVFIPEARKNSDENSQLLLSIYDAANGSGKVENVASNDENNAPQNNDSYETVKKAGVGNLSSIVGKWVSGSSGSMTTTTSGVYLGGNGSRHTYEFSANGAVEYTGIMNIMTGGCRMQIFKTAKGKATLSGGTLTIAWAPASFSRDDSCSPSKNYKKTLPAETETFQINFETYYDDKQLCLTGSDKTCFSRD
ncbi:MAG TPA: hypothetical protein VIL74_22870 [Pyrinomonadaceae bacterium]|jgi:hypothetical protein